MAEMEPAERIRELRVWAGSHDKLAAMLRTDKLKATRTTVIRWEQGTAISPAYAARLSLVSQRSPHPLPPEAFDGGSPVTAATERLERVSKGLQALLAVVAAMAEEVETQLGRQTALLDLLERIAESFQAERRVPPARPAGGERR